jgi:hypothetical protein
MFSKYGYPYQSYWPSPTVGVTIPTNVDFTNWPKRRNVEAVLEGNLPSELVDDFVAPCGFIKDSLANMERCRKEQAPRTELPSTVAGLTTSTFLTPDGPTKTPSPPEGTPSRTGLSTLLTATVTRPDDMGKRAHPTIFNPGPRIRARYVDEDMGKN